PGSGRLGPRRPGGDRSRQPAGRERGADVSVAQPDRDDRYYDELSRLNNDLANAYRDLAKKSSELSRLNDQKNQLLGMAAHDLRNPLEVILTYSEFLLEEAAPKLDGDQVAFIETIRSS